MIVPTNVIVGVIGNLRNFKIIYFKLNRKIYDLARHTQLEKNVYRYTLSKNILFLQFIGVWFFLYHLPNEQDNKMECPIDYYRAPVGNSSILQTRVYDKE